MQEIRDEGSVGRGSSPGAGLCGFCVSDMNIPGFQQSWELDVGKPGHVASSLQIMLEAPIGSARYNNEFGRPVLTGFYRTFLEKLPLENGGIELRGYHKPMMLAGGLGSVRPQNSLKDKSIVPAGSPIVILGGAGEYSYLQLPKWGPSISNTNSNADRAWGRERFLRLIN